MPSEKADAIFLYAILRNETSRKMIHSFCRAYWKARRKGGHGAKGRADERLRDVVAEAVLIGFFELKTARPVVAAKVSRAEVERRIIWAVLASDGDLVALDDALDMISSAARARAA
jgi:hypothetical protein